MADFRALFPRRATRRLSGLFDHVPDAIEAIGFEARLREGSDRVDSAGVVTSAGGGIPALASAQLPSSWTGVGEICRTLSGVSSGFKGPRTLFLEFDLESDEVLQSPSVFVRTNIEPSAPGSELIAALRLFSPLVDDESLRLLPEILSTLNQLPTPAELVQIGCMARSEEPGLRVAVRIYPGDVTRALASRGLDPLVAAAGRAVPDDWPRGLPLIVQFDVGRTAPHRAGVEFSAYSAPPAAWRALLVQQVERGLACPNKVAELEQWGGLGASPALCVREVSHIKIGLAESGETEVKAYFGITPTALTQRQ